MISQFDAFLGRLIKAVYYAKPEILNASEKQLTFANLVQFGSIDAAREYILEKEVEAVLRESHIDHFEWLEKRLGISLRKGLDAWPAFVELTERRNLFVHTDGEVSSQYISVCEKQGVKLENDCKVGTQLHVSREYLQYAYETLFEIATKLAHVMWRKLETSELLEADTHLNTVCYNLLKEEKYNLAKKILSFAVSLPKHHSQRNKLVFIVNSSIAYKWGGELEKANEIISETDWSACSDEFQLASAVLMERFDEATQIMRSIGPEGKISKGDYKDWPVFRDFRQTPQFLETYKEIFGEILETIEVSKSPASDNQNEKIISITENESTLRQDYDDVISSVV